MKKEKTQGQKGGKDAIKEEKEGMWRNKDTKGRKNMEGYDAGTKKGHKEENTEHLDNGKRNKVWK